MKQLSLILLLGVLSSVPARAQYTVFDPTNASLLKVMKLEQAMKYAEMIGLSTEQLKNIEEVKELTGSISEARAEFDSSMVGKLLEDDWMRLFSRNIDVSGDGVEFNTRDAVFGATGLFKRKILEQMAKDQDVEITEEIDDKGLLEGIEGADDGEYVSANDASEKLLRTLAANNKDEVNNQRLKDVSKQLKEIQQSLRDKGDTDAAAQIAQADAQLLGVQAIVEGQRQTNEHLSEAQVLKMERLRREIEKEKNEQRKALQALQRQTKIFSE